MSEETINMDNLTPEEYRRVMTDLLNEVNRPKKNYWDYDKFKSHFYDNFFAEDPSKLTIDRLRELESDAIRFKGLLDDDSDDCQKVVTYIGNVLIAIEKMIQNREATLPAKAKFINSPSSVKGAYTMEELAIYLHYQDPYADDDCITKLLSDNGLSSVKKLRQHLNQYYEQRYRTGERHGDTTKTIGNRLKRFERVKPLITNESGRKNIENDIITIHSLLGL